MCFRVVRFFFKISRFRSIGGSFENKEYMLVAFLDIHRGCFQQHNGGDHKCPRGSRNLSGSSEKNQKYALDTTIVRAELRSDKLCRTTNGGRPQGSLLSPLLWLVVVNDLRLARKYIEVSSICW